MKLRFHSMTGRTPAAPSGPGRPRLDSWALGAALICGVLLPDLALAQGSFTVSVAPRGANVVLNQTSAVALRWNITGSAGFPITAPGVAVSAQGCFTNLPPSSVGASATAQCPPPSGIVELGRVNVALTGTLVSGGGTSTAFESLVIPQTVALKAQQLNISQFFYARSWNVSSVPAPLPAPTASALTCRMGSSAYGNFSVSRVALTFDGGRTDITVRQGASFKAYADIRYNGTGTLRAYWLVADPAVANTSNLDTGQLLGTPGAAFKPVGWRILSYFEKTITFGDRIVIPSPDIPGLPTIVTGQHLVRLEILQDRPSDAQVGIQLPDARYFVQSDRMGGQVVRAAPAVPLVAPADGAHLGPSPPTFSWLPVAGAAQYRLEVFEAEPRASALGEPAGDPTVELYRSGSGALRAITSMDAVGPRIFRGVTQGAVTSLTLHPGYLGRLRPEKTYLWRVAAVDGRGDPIANSPLRAFLFKGQ